MFFVIVPVLALWFPHGAQLKAAHRLVPEERIAVIAVEFRLNGTHTRLVQTVARELHHGEMGIESSRIGGFDAFYFVDFLNGFWKRTEMRTKIKVWLLFLPQADLKITVVIYL